jgi:Protein of unknown function (DUF3750)
MTFGHNQRTRDAKDATISSPSNSSREAGGFLFPGIRNAIPAVRAFLKPAALIFLILFVAPICLRLALFPFEDRVADKHSYDVEAADMSSIGLLPEPENHPSARVLIMSVPTAGEKGKFLSHHWVILKRKNAHSWSRYEVLGYSSRDESGSRNGKWLNSQPTLNRYAADGRWFGRDPIVLAEASDAAAEAMIPKIQAAIDNYETMAGGYRPWPGPNSNTFVAVVLRAVPELGATLPPTAIGKDFRPGPYLGLTDSRTGVEASLYGALGLKLGGVEGAEINVLSLVAGIDLRKPALKLPGFGRIDLAGGAHASVMTAR